MKLLKIGTRGSDLALAQTFIFRSALSRVYPKLRTDIITIHAQADIKVEAPLGDSSLDKGAFTRELENALLHRTIHVAVHSLKDLPIESSSPNLVLGAILPRASSEDYLISKHEGGLEALPSGASIATGSQRRKAQILERRPDL